ncbi:MAG: myxosortase-dependent metalloprotease, MXAN_2677/MXAN_2678 family [Myxococcaceae bacterium]
MSRWATLALLVSCTAWAQAAAQGRGFVRTRVPDRPICLHWEKRVYNYNFHFAGSQQTPADAEFLAMEAAFQTWRELARGCSDFRFEQGQDVGVAEIGFNPDSADNTNVLVYREQACRDVVPANDDCYLRDDCANVYQCWDHSDGTIALTTTTFSFKTGIIYDADVEFNAAPNQVGQRLLFTTVSSPQCDPGAESALCAATDVQNTLTHEIGHVIGLDHVDVLGSTMEPSAPPGEVSKRVLDTGTQAGFCFIYPSGDLTPPCEELAEGERRIVAVNRGTPGLNHMGCVAGTGAPALLAALLAVRALRRRRCSR